MIPVVLVYSWEEVFGSGVKQEMSLFAERQRDAQTGESLFDALVFDEEYMRLFRFLFAETSAEVDLAVAAYTQDIPPEMHWHEDLNYSDCPDYKLMLSMPDAWNANLTPALNSKIREYLVAKICYRWLETKAPQAALAFLERADAAMSKINSLLSQRTAAGEKKGYWWY
jgi:hypothetical protein